jgi:hypothetical protein
MAYDPYSRGDNPWLGNLDMPKSQPTAKPGASRAASLPAKKKKPAVGSASPASPPRRPAVAPASPPRRPAGLGELPGRKGGPEITAPLKEDRTDLLGAPVDPYGPDTERLGLPMNEMFPPKVPEMNLNPDERNTPMAPPPIPFPPPPGAPRMTPRADAALTGAPPNIPAGILAGPAPGSATIHPPPPAPGYSAPRTLQNTPFDTGPVTPMKMPQITPNAPLPPRPTGGPRDTPFDTGPVTPMQTPAWLRNLFGGGAG